MSDPKYLKDYVRLLKSMGPLEFRRRHPPVLAGLGIAGEVGGPTGDRQTMQMSRDVLEAQIGVLNLLGRIWVIRKSPYGLRIPEIVAGRGMDSDLIIPEYSVSKFHCHFTYDPPHEVRVANLFITDNGSLNGTAVRGARLRKGERCELEDGDEIAIGRIRFELLGRNSFIQRVANEAGIVLPQQFRKSK